MSRRRALVLGAAGQDGSYLCELLLEKGYDVTGVVRAPRDEHVNIAQVRDEIRLVAGNLADFDALEQEILEAEPTEIYNVASVSFAPDAWDNPLQTATVGAVAVARLLEIIRTSLPETRLFQASSALVFGRPVVAPQNERTAYAPVEPYGAAKAHADFLVTAYRDRYELFACSGIFYNHESPRRAERFVTRKIAKAAAAIKAGREQELVLGDLEARRDWGYAKDFVEAAWLMLQAEEPVNHVIATGELHSVGEFAEIAFAAAELDWREYTRTDTALARGGDELYNLVGDAAAARQRLGWKTSVTFKELVRLMVTADLNRFSS